MYRILIVDDDPEILEGHRTYLACRGYGVDTAEDAAAALALLRKHQYDILLLDVMLPGCSGYDLCREARRITGAPVLFLTALDEADAAGPEESITKPCRMEELEARILIGIRRSDRRFREQGIHALQRNPVSRTVGIPGLAAVLSRKEYDLLEVLLEHCGDACSHEEIAARLWPGQEADPRNIKAQIHNLRRKLPFLERIGGSVESVPGKGYRLSFQGAGKGRRGTEAVV